MTQMTLFFGADNPLSNWHPARFVVNGVWFVNNEQFMMYCKAKLFKEEEVARKIMQTDSPRVHKSLGRQVRAFREDVWNAKREMYVCKGCFAKFSQNPAMKDFLLATGDTELVEASPYDKIWGVGLAATDPRIYDKANWQGLNLLGECLMQVREDLREESFP
jgi:ribA/ribD-fused uncharacterized protein